ncbi:hypothetical protein KUTeg_012345, partial [Tegillarca granosa]
MDQRRKFYGKLQRMETLERSSDSESLNSSQSKPDPYVVAVDIGTTSLRSHVYDKREILSPKPGWSEMNPDVLLQQVIDCVKESVGAAGLFPHQVTCMGISVQRNTFITWDRETGKPFHNFITWRDLRSRDMVKNWNSSVRMKFLNNGSSFLHLFTRQKRFLAASVLKFITPQVTMRLIWMLENTDQMKERAYEGQLMFGCMETWLLWKLTGEKFEWSTVVCNLLNIPMSILPEIRDSSGDFGKTDPSIFGCPISITSLVGDQSAAMFGECCFDPGDVKVTMGTGTFVDLNTGNTPHASVAGLYPLVGWKIGDEIVFIAEGIISDTGSVMEWIKSIDFYEDVSETAQIAQSVPDSDGVYFISAFSGLQAPINDDKAVTLMLGMKPTTTKAHMIRAVLESLAFRFKILYEAILTETKLQLSYIRVDGGVCNNDFLMQLMSDLTYQTIDRAKQGGDMTSLGAAFLAGLAAGVWKEKSELTKIRQSEKVFHPQDTWSQYKHTFNQWERAVQRSKE